MGALRLGAGKRGAHDYGTDKRSTGKLDDAGCGTHKRGIYRPGSLRARNNDSDTAGPGLSHH